MANMSYARFENTHRDLQDCYDHLEDTPPSRSEALYRERIITLCQDILEWSEQNQDREVPNGR